MADIDNISPHINTVLMCSQFNLTECKLGNQQTNPKTILQSWFFVHCGDALVNQSSVVTALAIISTNVIQVSMDSLHNLGVDLSHLYNFSLDSHPFLFLYCTDEILIVLMIYMYMASKTE
jgi:hypothetical protein